MRASADGLPTCPPAATAKLIRVVGESAEISGGGTVVPAGDRVVGLVTESPRMVLGQQVVVRKRGVATMDFGQCRGGCAVIPGQPLAPAEDAPRGEHRRMACIAIERQAIAVQLSGRGAGLHGPRR